MQYRSVKGFSGAGQLGMLLVFTGMGILLAGIAQLIVAMQMMPGVPMSKMADEMMKAMLKPENVGYARLSQVLGTFFIFFVPAVLFMLVCHGKNSFWLGFNKHINAAQIVIGFFLIFSASIIAGPLADLSKQFFAHYPGMNARALKMENSYSEQVAILSNLKSWGEFIMAIVIMAFFPALFEEIFFRGAVQNLLEKWWKAPLLAVIATSLLFSIIHLSLYLFLSRAVLGFILGWMYHRSKNLWVNIVAHFLNNTVAVIQMFWISRHNAKIEPDKLDPKMPLWGGLVAIAITYGLFLLFEKYSVKNRNLVVFEEQNMLEKDDFINQIGKN